MPGTIYTNNTGFRSFWPEAVHCPSMDGPWYNSTKIVMSNVSKEAKAERSLSRKNFGSWTAKRLQFFFRLSNSQCLLAFSRLLWFVDFLNAHRPSPDSSRQPFLNLISRKISRGSFYLKIKNTNRVLFVSMQGQCKSWQ